MRRTGFFLTCLLSVVGLASCDIQERENLSLTEGEVEILLTQDTRLQIGTKSEADGLPEVDDFKVELFNSRGVRLYRDTYANSAGKKIRLNGGDYRLLAQWGDTLGVGFNSIYYVADTTFTVHGQTSEKISATARLAKVKVAVSFGDDIASDYPDYYAVVRSSANAKSGLRFDKSETRAGYVPQGDITLEVYALVDDVWMYYKAEPLACSNREFVTFNINTDPRLGQLAVEIRIDNSLDEQSRQIIVPAIAAPSSAPEVSFMGFHDSGDVVGVVSGVDDPQLPAIQANISAPGLVAKCWVDIEAAGLPSSVELVEGDSSDKLALKDAGLEWSDNLEGGSLVAVRFTKLISSLGRMSRYSAANPQFARFRVRVEDSKGKLGQSQWYRACLVPAEASLSCSEVNIWATRVYSITAKVDAGDPSKFKLQYGSSGNWSEVAPKSINGSTLLFDLSGLNPATEYALRTIYNGNEEEVSQELRLVTEAAAQVGNADFEMWHIESHAYKVVTTKYRDWYLPWESGESDIWWAVNSKKTMPASTTAAYQEYKCRPTVTYTNNDVYDGAHSALLAVVKIGSGANALGMGATGLVTAAGEMWIGTATDSGDHLTDGHSFPSRPLSLSFMYKYAPRGSEKFKVSAEILDSAWNVIAETSSEIGGEASSWTKCTLALEYSTMTVKAAAIRMSFVASTSGSSAETSQKQTYECAGSDETACLGSILKLDNIELEY